jgi:putative acetyltransferase
MASAMGPIRVRRERLSDVDAIGELIRSAFLGMPYADGDEADVVEALRSQDALSVSLVAESDGTIVGHVAFSPARASNTALRWFALGPLAVLPSHQCRGIGSALVRSGLGAISELGAGGCMLVGDPSYYSRFGFNPSPENAPPGQPPESFMVKVLRGELPIGPIFFHEAFGSAA